MNNLARKNPDKGWGKQPHASWNAILPGPQYKLLCHYIRWFGTDPKGCWDNDADLIRETGYKKTSLYLARRELKRLGLIRSYKTRDRGLVVFVEKAAFVAPASPSVVRSSEPPDVQNLNIVSNQSLDPKSEDPNTSGDPTTESNDLGSPGEKSPGGKMLEKIDLDDEAPKPEEKTPPVPPAPPKSEFSKRLENDDSPEARQHREQARKVAEAKAAVSRATWDGLRANLRALPTGGEPRVRSIPSPVVAEAKAKLAALVEKPVGEAKPYEPEAHTKLRRLWMKLWMERTGSEYKVYDWTVVAKMMKHWFTHLGSDLDRCERTMRFYFEHFDSRLKNVLYFNRADLSHPCLRAMVAQTNQDLLFDLLKDPQSLTQFEKRGKARVPKVVEETKETDLRDIKEGQAFRIIFD